MIAWVMYAKIWIPGTFAGTRNPFYFNELTCLEYYSAG